ncbi:MAG: MMPL family transporter, partial [Clostridiales bacterium]|nr:MMPL family transporter [Clostridiales bacterium]
PQEILPKDILGILKGEKWELMLINSQYGLATDALNDQIDQLNSILKKHDPKGLLIGEGPCTKDLIETTDKDFRIVTIVSVVLVFLIIALVTKSISLPFILISVIELAIFINLGIPHLTGSSMPFVGPIFISTIQLGATVDYAILMTTRYKDERMRGIARKEAVWTALRTSIPSILVSGTGLFAATIGVAIYSDVDMISSMCILLARGALVSMLLVIFILPSMLMAFDGLIKKTTAGMKDCDKNTSETRKELFV